MPPKYSGGGVSRGCSPCQAAGVGSAHLSVCGQASEDVFPNSPPWCLSGAASHHGSGFFQGERSQPVFVLNYLIYFLLHWVFVTVCRVSLVVASEGFLAGRGFLIVVASLGVEHGLQAHRLCSCGPQA